MNRGGLTTGIYQQVTSTGEEATAKALFGALWAIAERCDGAISRDNTGFNQPDAAFANAVIFQVNSTPQKNFRWSPETLWATHDMLGKYRKQLEAAGVDYDTLPVPQQPSALTSVEARRAGRKHVAEQFKEHQKEMKKEERRVAREQVKLERAAQKHNENLLSRKISVEHTDIKPCFVIEFRYEPQIVHDVKMGIPGSSYDPGRTCWTAPASSYTQVLELAERHQFQIEGHVISFIEQNKVALQQQQGMEKRYRNGRIYMTGNRVAIDTPYAPEVVADIAKLPGRKWHPAEKINTVAASPELVELAERHNIFVEEDVNAHIDRIRDLREASRTTTSATTTTFNVEDFGVDLYGYQRAGIEAVLRAAAIDKPKVFIADEPGLGKTFQAIGATEKLEAYPVAVVVPASLKRNWEKEFRKATPGRTTLVVDGKQPKIFTGVDVVILNYEILAAHLNALHEHRIKGVIFDESHYLKNPKAGRTKAAFHLVEPLADNAMVLCLSGTPTTNKTREFVTQFKLLGRLNDVTESEKNFLFTYCEPQQEGGYGGRMFWKFDGASNTDQLQKLMREGSGEEWVNDQGVTRIRSGWYVRRHKKDVLGDLPEKTRQTTVVSLDTQAREEYRKAERDVATYVADTLLKELREEKGGEFTADDIINSLDPTNKRYVDMGFNNADEYNQWVAAKIKITEGEMLTRTAVLRRVAAEQKLPAVKEWIDTFAEGTGRKLVVFAHHKTVVDELADHYKAPKISGSVNLSDREKAVEQFQTNPDTKIVVCNLQAAGVGLTLTAASDVLFVEQGWTPAEMDQAEDRVHRIGQQESVTAHYLLAENTIDEYMFNVVQKKRKIVASATDGAPTPTIDILNLLGKTS